MATLSHQVESIHYTKGIKDYAWISVQDYSVTFSVPGAKNSYSTKAFRSWFTWLLENSSKYTKGYDGNFTWTVTDCQGKAVASKSNLIDTFTGNLVSDDMMDIFDM